MRWVVGAIGLAALLPCLTADRAAAIALSYAEPIPLGGFGYRLATGDLNGDGRSDLVTWTDDGMGVWSPDDPVVVLLADDAGGFRRIADSPTARMPHDLLVAELDGDGIPDLAIAEAGGVAVMHGNGDGSFGSSVPVGTGTGGDLLAADLDGDGRNELVILTHGPGWTPQVVSLRRVNEGWVAGPTVSLPRPLSRLATGDFDGDGRADVAGRDTEPHGPEANTSRIWFLWGTGTGGLVVGASVKVPWQAMGLAAADFDRDGAADVAVQSTQNRGVTTLLRGRADRSPVVEQAATDSGSILGWGNIAAGLVDGDAIPDVVAPGGAVLFGGSDGAFTGGELTSPPGSEVVVADFDGDGAGDIATIDSREIHVAFSGPRVFGAFNNGLPAAFGTEGSVLTYRVGFTHLEPQPIVVSSARLVGADADLFELGPGCVGDVVPSRTQCSLVVRYRPTSRSLSQGAMAHVLLATSMGRVEIRARAFGVPPITNLAPARGTPVRLTPARILGDPRPGETLTCDVGTFEAEPTARGYIWERSRKGAITGATSATYVVTGADVGRDLRCEYWLTGNGVSVHDRTPRVAVRAGPVVKQPPDVGLTVGATRMRDLGTRGVPLTVTCSTACRVTTALLADRRTLKRAGLKPRAAWTVVGRTDRTAPATKSALAPRVAGKYARALARLKSARLTLDVRAVDGRGKVRRLSRMVDVPR